MAPQTIMAIYQDVVLECQHCYVICRYAEAAARHNCPACGLAIANWDELRQTVQTPAQPSPAPVESPANPG
jgi:predicted RNA-binding Zn-ribbon protein involved in translation (DUF1610 family)